MGRMSSNISRESGELLRAAETCRVCLGKLHFQNPVAYVYNPLQYAWAPYRRYLERYATSRKRVLLLGMNPGPWGMAQTGVPFGDVQAVRDWLGIEGAVKRPTREHPRRPVTGFSVNRGEVSGKRLWGLMKERFGCPERFFSEHFVGNYCPLLFLDSDGKNITPDKLRSRDRDILFRCCDAHLEATIRILDPIWLVGVGRFAEQRLRSLTEQTKGQGTTAQRRVTGILHPSPASPAANRGWAAQVSGHLETLGVW
jgi:single-strand selective monofunctional uracil DNA glycosylase